MNSHEASATCQELSVQIDDLSDGFPTGKRSAPELNSRFQTIRRCLVKTPEYQTHKNHKLKESALRGIHRVMRSQRSSSLH